MTRRSGGDLVIQGSTVRGVVDVSGVKGFIAIINNESPGALGRVRVVNNDLRRLDATSTVGLNISSNQVATDATVSGNKGKVEKNVQGNTVGGTLSCIDRVAEAPAPPGVLAGRPRRSGDELPVPAQDRG